MKRVLALLPGLFIVAALVAPGGVLPPRRREHFANHPLHVRPNASTSPTGLSPSQIIAAYSFPTSSSAGAARRSRSSTRTTTRRPRAI